MATGKLLPNNIRTFSNRHFNFRTNGTNRMLSISAIRRCDFRFGGLSKLVGTVAISGSPELPVSRKVRLYRRNGGGLARETYSDSSGNFSFRYIDNGPWMVVAIDHTNEYNAVIADNITGEPM